MATYEVTLRDVADSVAKLGERVDKLGERVDGRMDALASQITDLRSELSDLRSDVTGLRGEWRLAKWVLAVFGAPALGSRHLHHRPRHQFVGLIPPSAFLVH